jgi:hypothetical protein
MALTNAVNAASSRGNACALISAQWGRNMVKFSFRVDKADSVLETHRRVERPAKPKQPPL